MDLKEKSAQRKVAVDTIGLGYVGLPIEPPQETGTSTYIIDCAKDCFSR
jgi:UDP-N-acetyl-D-mannosaminuronate dehydrogenase